VSAAPTRHEPAADPCAVVIFGLLGADRVLQCRHWVTSHGCPFVARRSFVHRRSPEASINPKQLTSGFRMRPCFCFHEDIARSGDPEPPELPSRSCAFRRGSRSSLMGRLGPADRAGGDTDALPLGNDGEVPLLPAADLAILKATDVPGRGATGPQVQSLIAGAL
jgi:hypothetical protein